MYFLNIKQLVSSEAMEAYYQRLSLYYRFRVKKKHMKKILDKKKSMFNKERNWPFAKIFLVTYEKYREPVLYIIFGCMTFALSNILYILLSKVVNLNILFANIISWTFGVFFSFFTTKKWVFKSVFKNIKELFGKIGSFFITRIMALLLQEVLLYFFVIQLKCDDFFVKICTDIIVIALNYVTSKFYIFTVEK